MNDGAVELPKEILIIDMVDKVTYLLKSLSRQPGKAKMRWEKQD